MRALLLACLLAACGSSSKPAATGPTILVGGGESTPDAAPPASPQACGGSEGCPEGELCCYPCGIGGCQDVCMAVTECPAYP